MEQLSCLTENKVDLAQFLSNKLIEGAPPDKLFVVSGDEDQKEVGCSRQDVDVSALRATHEEADTRIILHAINVDVDALTVSVRDTDVLLLSLSYAPLITCKDIRMMAATAKKIKYISIRTFAGQMPSGSLPSLLSFYAITGCDSTSCISGHTKNSFGQHLKFTTVCYVVLEKDNLLINYIGRINHDQK